MEHYGRVADDWTLTARAALASALPLKIDRAEVVAEITLSLGGTGWTLSATCDWTWRNVDGLVVTDSTPDAADLVWDLIGDEIVSVAWTEERGFGFDPRFVLSSGGSLELLSDVAFDTWVIGLPTETLVGPFWSDQAAAE